jgi:transaldolase
VDGVTTNPTLVAKENRPFREHILEICEILKGGVVNAEVVSTDTDNILREAREIASWHPNVVVKIPMIPDGVRALSILSKEGIRVNVTLCFSASQALLVAKVARRYL